MMIPKYENKTTYANKAWTTNDDEVLSRLLAAGKPYTEIAALFQRTIASIRQRASKLKCTQNIPSKKWSDAEIKTLIDMINEGKTFKQMSDNLNRTQKAIKNYCRKYNVKIKSKALLDISIVKPVSNKNTTKKHDCLVCHHGFIYEDIGNWICPKCKRATNEASHGLPEYSIGAIG